MDVGAYNACKKRNFDRLVASNKWCRRLSALLDDELRRGSRWKALLYPKKTCHPRVLAGDVTHWDGMKLFLLNESMRGHLHQVTVLLVLIMILAECTGCTSYSVGERRLRVRLSTRDLILKSPSLPKRRQPTRSEQQKVSGGNDMGS